MSGYGVGRHMDVQGGCALSISLFDRIRKAARRLPGVLLTLDVRQTIVAAERRGSVSEGRVHPFAVVTGASRGIGAEYAKALAAAGYDVLLVGRDRARLERLASRLTDMYSVSAHPEVIDLAISDAAQQLYVAARQRRPQIDVLVNNAGFGLFGPFIDMPMPKIQEMLRLHMNTIVESMRLFLPGMVERSSGAIINVASTAGLFPLPFMAEYAATKTFLIALSQALAEEVRPFGVRIQACCPGSTETEFHQSAGFRPNNPLGSDMATHVVKASLAALSRGPVVVTIGWRGRLVWWLSRLVPIAIITKVAGTWLQRRPQAEGDRNRR